MRSARLRGLITVKNLQTLDLPGLTEYIVQLYGTQQKSRVRRARVELEAIEAEQPETIFDTERHAEKLELIKQTLLNIESGLDCKRFKTKAEAIIFDHNDDPDHSAEFRQKFIDLVSSLIEVKIESKTDDDFEEAVSEDLIPVAPKSRNKEDNTDRDNFYKALMRYQSNSEVPEDLLNKLDRDFFGRYPHLQDRIRTNAEKLPLLPNGTRKNTSRPLMLQALKETKNPLFYDRVNAICTVYWKWKTHDLSSLIPTILKDFDATQGVYNAKIKGKMRKSNLNIQYRLFKHLQVRGHVCSIDDFKMIGGREILIQYDEMWKIMIEGAGISELIFIKTA